MKRSPLQLESCWLEFVALTPAGSEKDDDAEGVDQALREQAASDADNEAPDDQSPDHQSEVSDIETELAVLFHWEDPDIFRVRLRVKTPERCNRTPYALDIEMTGQFRVAPSYADPAARSRLVSNAAPSIVYGAIRDQVLTLTTRASSGPWVIPTVMFPIHENIVWTSANAEPPPGPSKEKKGQEKKKKEKKPQ